MDDPVIIETERNGSPCGPKLCVCGTEIDPDAKECQKCYNEYWEHKEDEADDDELFGAFRR